MEGDAEAAALAELSCLRSELQYGCHELRLLSARRRRVEAHIVALHRYNEMKDVTQSLMGKLAEMEGGITRELYPALGLQLTD